MYYVQTEYCPALKSNEILIYNNIDKPENMVRKPDTKGQTPYNYIYMRYLEQANSETKKYTGSCQGLRGGGMEKYYLTCTEFQFGKMRKFWR